MKYLFNYILLKILRAYVSSTIIDTTFYYSYLRTRIANVLGRSD